MVRQVDAVYEKGVFRPLEPFELGEHKHVRLTVEECVAPRSWVSQEPVNERREEMEWLAKESGPLAGQWVALEGSKLVAHGVKLAAVRAAAREARAADPLYARVPHTDMPSGGW